jgi:hypothetical protein
MGLALGLFVVGLLIGQGCENRRMRRAKAGWNSVTRLVANRALRAGVVLGPGMLEPREVLEQFATDALLQPEQEKQVLGQPLLFDLERGQPLRWSMVPSTWKLAECQATCQARGQATR